MGVSVFFVSVIKSNVRGNELFGFYIPGHNPLREVKTETQASNSCRIHGALAAYCFAPRGLLIMFSDTTQDCLPRGSTEPPELGPCTTIIKQENAPTLAYKQSDGKTFPNEVLLQCHGAIYLVGENRLIEQNDEQARTRKW